MILTLTVSAASARDDFEQTLGPEYAFIRHDGDVDGAAHTGESLDVAPGNGLFEMLDVGSFHFPRERNGVLHAPVGFIRVDSYLEIIPRRFPHGQHPRRIRRHVSTRLYLTSSPAALIKAPRLARRLIGRLDADPGV